MTDALPNNMRAFVQHETRTASIRQIAVPKLQPNEVLIKVAYAALNPADQKGIDMISPPGAIIGSDLSGTIVALGSDVENPELVIGTRVATLVTGAKYPDQGSFAEYCKAESELVWTVPDGLRLEEAAAYPMALITNGQLLFQSLGQALPPAKVPGSPWLLVYGASTGMGMFTVQLAKAAGYRVVATASPRNFELCKALGADAVVDYSDAGNAVSQIKEITGGGVSRAIDLIAVKDSLTISLNSFGDGPDNQLRVTLPRPEETASLRPDVNVVNTIVYTAFGKPFSILEAISFPAIPENRAFHEQLVKIAPQLITDYNIRPPPIDVRDGLESIDQAIEEMRQAQISGKKIVFKITQ